MGQDSIDKVLAAKRVAAVPAIEGEADKFYSILVGEGMQEHYLEFRLRTGLRVCLSYTDLSWFTYAPEGPQIDLEFGGIAVRVKGRGLGDALFNGIKQKRVGWIKVADLEMQDHPENKVFVEEITFSHEDQEAETEE